MRKKCFRLNQIVDLDEKNQILTSNMWLSKYHLFDNIHKISDKSMDVSKSLVEVDMISSYIMNNNITLFLQPLTGKTIPWNGTTLSTVVSR